MNQEIIQKASEIIKKSEATGGYNGQYCTLAVIDSEGYPTASTITVSKSDGIHWLTFCTSLQSDKAKRIEKCNRASVCFNAGGAYNLTLVGTIEIETCPEVKKEMWYTGLENHYSGAADPNFCVLRFKTKRYNLMVDWQETQGVLE